MRVLYVRIGSYLPELYAGASLAMHGLLKALQGRGHRVAVHCGSRRVEPDQSVRDQTGDYVVVRAGAQAWPASARRTIRRGKPDVVVTSQHGPWMERLAEHAADLPFVVYEHEISTAMYSPPRELRPRLRYVANSAVTAAHLKRTADLDAVVVPPIFGIPQYAGQRSFGTKALFVSMQVSKGADIVLQLAAARPDVGFVICATWTQDLPGTNALRARAMTLANVTLLPNQPGLGQLFGQTRVLLMPSRWEEAWGLTATEAQVCGIPVLASTRGNLPETIGAGGVLLDPDGPIERWIEAFSRIVDDPATWSDLSRKALARGRAVLDQVEPAVDAFDQALHDAVGRRAVD